MKKALLIIVVVVLSLSSCFISKQEMLVTKKYEMTKTKEYKICGKVDGYMSTQQITTASKKRYNEATIGKEIKVTNRELKKR